MWEALGHVPAWSLEPFHTVAAVRFAVQCFSAGDDSPSCPPSVEQCHCFCGAIKFIFPGAQTTENLLHMQSPPASVAPDLCSHSVVLS